jgi:hypothetical protein
MVTRGNIATNHLTASNTVVPTTARRAQNIGKPQQSAPYVEDRTPQTIKDVNTTDSYSEVTIPTK